MGSTGAKNNITEVPKYRKIFKGTGNSEGLTATVRHFTPLGQWNGQYSVSFDAFGAMNNDYRGTNGTGMKVYDTEEKAISAAKRYVKKWG